MARPLPGRTDYGGVELARTACLGVSFPYFFGHKNYGKARSWNARKCDTITRSGAPGSKCTTLAHLVKAENGALLAIVQSQIIHFCLSKSDVFLSVVKKSIL